MSSTNRALHRRPRRRRRGRPAIRSVVIGAVAVTLVAVAGGYLAWPDRPAENDVLAAGKLVGAGPTERPTPEPTTVPEGEVDMAGRAPLTGLPAGTALDHPAVTVKISNTPDAHPHRGLDQADIVFVEPITGATTRLAAVFHSRLPTEAGPVRSLRPMDAPLIGPTRGVLANTMAQDWVLHYVDTTADVANLGTMRVPRGTYRLDSARVAPNHVFASAEALLARTDRNSPPTPYFRYAHSVPQSSAQRVGAPAATVSIGYGDPSTAIWTYDGDRDRWLRAEAWSDHLLENGAQVAADNVVVLRAARDWSFPQATSDMTILDLVNTAGPVEVFTGDAVVAGRWSKGGVNEPFELTTEDGEPLLLAPGTTWVELALDTMAVTVGRDKAAADQ
jgi:hypothetical protein